MPKYNMIVKNTGDESGSTEYKEVMNKEYIDDASASSAASTLVTWFNDTRKSPNEPERELVRVEVIPDEPDTHECPDCDEDCSCVAGQTDITVCEHDCDEDDE